MKKRETNTASLPAVDKSGQPRRSVLKYIVIGLFLFLSLFSIKLMERVNINYDISDYLDERTDTKVALGIMEKEFGLTGNIQVMIPDIDKEAAKAVTKEIADIPHVLNVSFDEDSTGNYKDGTALFVVLVNGDDYSDNAVEVAADIHELLDGRYSGVELGGTAIEKQQLHDDITYEMSYILIVAVALVIILLLVTAGSWLEPLILLLASGAAVLINYGTNYFLGEISYITNSIFAILQLALSIDYSIVLLHTYRAEKQTSISSDAAMRKALKNVLRPVSASALTTLAGLLALLFMSFRFGFDIGIVLMKGIVISAITSLTLFPSLVLLFDKPLEKTRKKPFIPKGAGFAAIAKKACGVIVPIGLIILLGCGVLQTKTTFTFTDANAGNPTIKRTFGQNNTVIVVYKNTEDAEAKEGELTARLSPLKKENGNPVLTDITAYNGTIHEEYDMDKAVRKMGINKSDAETLYAMYYLYRDPASVTMTAGNFIEYASELTKVDEDAKSMVDASTQDTVSLLLRLREILNTSYSAKGLADAFNSVLPAGQKVDADGIANLYDLYAFNAVSDTAVPYETMLSYLIDAGQNDPLVSKTMGSSMLANLKELQSGIAELKAGYADYQTQVADAQRQLDQIPEWLRPLFPITIPEFDSYVPGGTRALEIIGKSYTYSQFIPATADFVNTLRDYLVSEGKTVPAVSGDTDSMRMAYMLYCKKQGMLSSPSFTARSFISYAKKARDESAIVASQLSAAQLEQMSDLLTVDSFFADETQRNYKEMTDYLNEMHQKYSASLPQTEEDATLSADLISGLYIKYGLLKGLIKTDPILSTDLLDFVSNNMDTNELLKTRVNDEMRVLIKQTRADIEHADHLFRGANYSRILLSVDLPNEGAETQQFVTDLKKEVTDVFGADSYIAGEIVSTEDLRAAFDDDNKMISIFTIVSIFIIVMLTFLSFSLPLILVIIIQGAIWIAMATGLITGDPIFFMSYIIATCILMGATIDYGILLSSSYVKYRADHDKPEALRMALETAMPTVFTSGLILTVCGLVIHFISSQNSISPTGLLIGKGAFAAVVVVTLILPSILYLLDKFVLALTVHKRKKKAAPAEKAAEPLPQAAAPVQAAETEHPISELDEAEQFLKDLEFPKDDDHETN